MSNTKYYWELEKYSGKSSRYECPSCHRKNEFTRYIDSEGNYAGEEFGICNRIEKCSYKRYPNGKKTIAEPIIPKLPKPQEFIDWKDYNYDLEMNSHFIQFLIKTFSEEKAQKALKMYYVRTKGNYMVFPCIDKRNRLTFVEMIEYQINGKRTKYVHTPFTKNHGNYKACLFGLHIVDGSKPLYVVEAAKTAIICSIVYPEYHWLSTQGMSGISKISVLESAMICADKGKAFQNWKEKTDHSPFKMELTMELSDMTEGSDLADYILEYYTKDTNSCEDEPFL